jgi:hypothetical protein
VREAEGLRELFKYDFDVEIGPPLAGYDYKGESFGQSNACLSHSSEKSLPRPGHFKKRVDPRNPALPLIHI